MHPTTLLLAVLLPSVLATNLNSPLRLSLLKRQDVGTCSQSGYVVCGNDCMPEGDNCCNADGDYCPSDETCGLGDNGVAGCCPAGESCSGDGGTQTVNGATLIGGAATSSFTSLPSGGGGGGGVAAQTTGTESSLSLQTTFPSSTAGNVEGTSTGNAVTATSTGGAAGAVAMDGSMLALLVVAAGNMLL